MLCSIKHLSKYIYRKNTPCTIGAMYRHSHPNITLFQKKMEYALHNLNKSKGINYIVGYFNINLLNTNNNTEIKSYSNMIYSQGCLPIITQPTRITENSSTLIDHVYTNNTTKEIKSFILLYDLTDHMPIIVSTNLKKLN